MPPSPAAAAATACATCGAARQRHACPRCGQILWCRRECFLETLGEHTKGCRPLELQKADAQLWGASFRGDARAVTGWLGAGANVNYPDPDHRGAPPLIGACQNGHNAVVRILIRAGADVNQTTTDEWAHSPLSAACCHGRADLVEMLLDAGARINQRRPGGPTCVMLAADKGHVKVVRILIDREADVNLVMRDAEEGGREETALSISAYKGRGEVASALCVAGANVNYARSQDGVTALMLAAQGGHIDVVRTLCYCGADANLVATDALSSSALTLASQNGAPVEVIKSLLSAGADIHHARSDGFDALMMACQMGHADVVAELVAAGADSSRVARNGCTALFLSTAFGHPNISCLLRQRRGRGRGGGGDAQESVAAASWIDD